MKEKEVVEENEEEEEGISKFFDIHTSRQIPDKVKTENTLGCFAPPRPSDVGAGSIGGMTMIFQFTY